MQGNPSFGRPGMCPPSLCAEAAGTVFLSPHCTALHCTALHCTALHCTQWLSRFPAALLSSCLPRAWLPTFLSACQPRSILTHPCPCHKKEMTTLFVEQRTPGARGGSSEHFTSRNHSQKAILQPQQGPQRGLSWIRSCLAPLQGSTCNSFLSWF